MKKAIGTGLLFAAALCGSAGIASARSGLDHRPTQGVTPHAGYEALVEEGLPMASGVDFDPLSPQAVSQLYAGKTWYWKTGAAYFAPNGSCQITLRESKPSAVHKSRTCTWAAHEYGRMIFEAYWTNAPSRGFFAMNEWRHTRASFAHEQNAAGNIFQRKDDCANNDIPWEGWSWDHETSCSGHATGTWYVFKHAAPVKGDEWWMLQPGNRTSEVLKWKM